VLNFDPAGYKTKRDVIATFECCKVVSRVVDGVLGNLLLSYAHAGLAHHLYAFFLCFIEQQKIDYDEWSLHQ